MRILLASVPGKKVGLSANPYANSTFDFDVLFDEFQDYVAHESLFPSGLSRYEFSEQFDRAGWQKPVKLVRSYLGHEYPF